MLAAWRTLGGLETLMSYGIKPSMTADPAQQLELAKAFGAALPGHDGVLLRSLPPSFVANAGVKPGVRSSTLTAEEDLLRIREDVLVREVSAKSSQGTHPCASQTFGPTGSTLLPAPAHRTADLPRHRER
jgi:hypothetical protein